MAFTIALLMLFAGSSLLAPGVLLWFRHKK